MYMKAVRALLGVRATTPTNVCLVEGGFKPLESLVKTRQQKFFKKMITAREEMSDDPLMHAISIVKEHNRPVWSYMETILNGDKFVEEELHNIKQAIHYAPPSATKSRTYINLNPTLEVHPLYTDCTTTIPDYLRISFTRFRTSSHIPGLNVCANVVWVCRMKIMFLYVPWCRTLLVPSLDIVLPLKISLRTYLLRT